MNTRTMGRGWDQSTRAKKSLEITELLQQALQTLSSISEDETHSSRRPAPPLEDDDCRRWADLVVDSMTTPGRFYHDVDHVFQVAEPFLTLPPQHPHRAVGTLAAIFHDMIYLSIDGELLAEQCQVLLPDVELCPDNSTLRLYEPEHPPDSQAGPESCTSLIAMALRVFGLEVLDDASGRDGGFAGPSRKVVPLHKAVINELLCALMAVKLLHTVMSRRHLFQLVACIEASIPFRMPQLPEQVDHVESPALYTTPIVAVLHLRWGAVARDFHLGLSESEVAEVTQLATAFSNADVGSFAAAAPEFLENSWRLLPEWNPVLAAQPTTRQASLRDVQVSLAGLLGRYPTLRVDAIFQAFRGRPDNLPDLRKRTTQNLDCVGNYTRVRFFSLAVLIDALSLFLRKPDGGGDDFFEAALRSSEDEGGELAVLRRFEGGARCQTLWSEQSTTPTLATNPDDDRTNANDRLWHCLTTPRRACSWGDATETHASALLYCFVDWETIVARSPDADDNASTVAAVPGGTIRLVPEPARGAILAAVREALPPTIAAMFPQRLAL